MKAKPTFYNKPTAHGKQCYDALEAITPHSDRFIELMSKECPADEWQIHTEEEVICLAKEDLLTLTELFPDEADWYMNKLTWD